MSFIKMCLLWTFFIPVKYLVWFMPYGIMYRCCWLLSFFGIWFKNRKVAAYLDQLENIDRAYTKSEKKEILKRTFWVLLCNEVEMLCFPKIHPGTIDDLVSYKGLHHVETALRSGKGVMLLFAHLGANQMIMPAMGYRGYEMNQLSAPATVWEDKIPDRRFGAMEKLAMKIRWDHELSLPVHHINIFGSLKDVFKCLKRNQILGVAMDGGGGAERIPVEFMEHKMNLSTGAYEIARRTGCAVLPTFMERNIETGKNVLNIEKAIYVRKENSQQEDKKKFIQFFANRLVVYVRKSPWLYLNFMALRHMMVDYDEIPFLIKNKLGKH